MKITEKSKVIDVIREYRGTIKVFNKYKLDCPQCKGAGQDSIEKVALYNGLSLKDFISELNIAADLQ